MQVEIRLDESCREPRVLILTDAVTEEVRQLLERLEETPPQLLTGVREERVEILEPDTILRVYAAGGKVLAATTRGEFTLRQRLYELEQRLDPWKFVRISNSEIINLSRVKHFDLRITGTICVRLADGSVTYVSRRYVSKIKKILGV